MTIGVCIANRAPLVRLDPHARAWAPRTRRPPMHYADFQFLKFEKKTDGVMLMTLNRPEVLNATNARLHWELTKIWAVLDDDKDVRVVVVTGAGERAFSAGGDLDWIGEMVGNAAKIEATLKEAGDIVF